MVMGSHMAPVQTIDKGAQSTPASREERRRVGRAENSHENTPEERGRSRKRRRAENEHRNSNNDDSKDSGTAEGSPTEGSPTEGTPRKRRRSRKGLDKKFECPFEACGKSYSRAEHLHRHQLNREFEAPCSFHRV